MHFFGVQTAGSSALRLFPRWAKALGIDARLVGVDLPLNAPPERYRQAVQRLKEDANVAGALVTSHKLNVVRAAGDLFDGFTDDAQLTGEVSAIYKRSEQGRTLWGDAVDARTAGLALEQFLGADYWARHPDAELLCLGAGGAAVALLLHLQKNAPSRPQRLTAVDIRHGQIEHLQAVLDKLPPTPMQTHFATIASGEADALIDALPPRSLVINATGMGKDTPGSPLSDAAIFPQRGAVWELNYRGARPFLQQARAQQTQRDLRIADGWGYFLLGWSTVIGRVFDIEITPQRFARFAEASR